MVRMNKSELIGLLISQDVVLLTMIILFFIGLILVPVHWLILGKQALDRGRVRVESVGSAESCKKDEKMV